MQKTGEPVYVPLPPDVVTMLRELPNPDNLRYFFWNGTSDIASPGIRWWSTLKTIFKAAGLPNAHPHMLRDTFAVEMLLAGVPIDQVSILLGHSSVKITEKHYSPWVRARQEQLENSVRKAWAPILWSHVSRRRLRLLSINQFSAGAYWLGKHKSVTDKTIKIIF